ncbi:hypothetical protein [Phenylobacterium sp.]|uniref:hypothetical protein n=1 Tax=Phenylobacterium sp. TaxID=1871053 RepID=UPI003002B186
MQQTHPVRAAARSPTSLGDYANLRRGGTSPGKARALLRLEDRELARLERAFRGQVARGAGEAQPRFARHELHVAKVMAQGGFAALTETRVGRNGVHVGLPLVWPEAGR